MAFKKPANMAVKKPAKKVAVKTKERTDTLVPKRADHASPTVTDSEDEDNLQVGLEALSPLLGKGSAATAPITGRYRTQSIIFELSEQDRLSLHDPMHRPIFKNWDFYGYEMVSLDGGLELDPSANTLKCKVILKETGMNSSVCLLILGYSAPLWMPPTPVTRPWETTEAVRTDSGLLGKTFVLTRY